jgi:hypothetical protein
LNGHWDNLIVEKRAFNIKIIVSFLRTENPDPDFKVIPGCLQLPGANETLL